MIKLMHGDCLQKMHDIEDGSIDLVLADPPYGSTACKWDSLIPLEPLWQHLKRVLTPVGCVVMMASQPFTTTLISSNSKMFKYCWVWEKNFSTNFLHAKRQPLRKTEDVVVFFKQASFYYPIKTIGHPPTQSAKGSSKGRLWHGTNVRDAPGGETTRYPTNILRINAVDPKKRVHSTQKPVALMEYLIQTYTTKGQTVLDFSMGSGTTMLAAKQLGRHGIGIELDEGYFEIAQNRTKEK